MANKALPERDEHLASFIKWLSARLNAVQDPADRHVLRGFATWTHLRRLRIDAERGPLAYGQLAGPRGEISAAIRLLTWLHGSDRRLADLTQADLDHWLATSPAGAIHAGPFLRWCLARGHAADLHIPVRVPIPRGSVTLPEPDQRWQLVRRLLHDSGIPTVDRVAASLVLLYGQPVSRIVVLRADHVTDSATGLRLQLGSEPVDIPEPLADLIRTLVTARTRPTGRTIIGREAQHPWLFPGGHAGRHISAARLGVRLTELGFFTRAARATALMELAAELPPIVLSKLLGIHVQTATSWSQAAGNTRPGYAAAVSRRSNGT